MSTTGSRHAERIEVPKVSVHFCSLIARCQLNIGQNNFMSSKRKNRKDRSSVSSVSDSELCSPEEKQVKEVSVSESRFLV